MLAYKFEYLPVMDLQDEYRSTVLHFHNYPFVLILCPCDHSNNARQIVLVLWRVPKTYKNKIT